MGFVWYMFEIELLEICVARHGMRNCLVVDVYGE